MGTNREIALFSILFLFFFQLLTEFIAAVYAFGLLGVNVPVETVAILLFFSPFLLVPVRTPLPGKLIALLGAAAALSSLIAMFAGTRERMLLSGFGTACVLVFIPAYLSGPAYSGGRGTAARLTAALASGTALFILFRALNSGVYPYEEPWFRTVSAALAAAAAFLLFTGSSPWKDNADSSDAPEDAASGAGKPGLFAATLGFFAVVALLYFAFASPYVIARWTGAERLFVLTLSAASLGLFSIAFTVPAVRAFLLKPRVLVTLNLVFLASIAGTLLPHRVWFPADPSAFPVYEPAPGTLSGLPLVVMLLVFPVIFLDSYLFLGAFIAAKPAPKKAGIAFGLGALFLLLAVFAQVFTTVYDYIPVIGPLFRDRFIAVFLVVGCCLALPAAFTGRPQDSARSSVPGWVPAAVILFGLAAVAGAALLPGGGSPAAGSGEGVRVLTWNIQQGYSGAGERSHREQLAELRRSGAGIIGLQETDSARVSGGNADLSGYFAERLGMHAYHGPKTASGTFGIALLSRYELLHPRTFFMYSEGEQTAAIHAQIRVRGTLYDVFVTHLGNDGDMVQQRAVLAEAAKGENVIIMGDFNFTPETEQYAVTAGLFDDAWKRSPAGTGAERPKRIDHIFVSKEIEVLSAGYLESPASDHPALLVELR